MWSGGAECGIALSQSCGGVARLQWPGQVALGSARLSEMPPPPDAQQQGLVERSGGDCKVAVFGASAARSALLLLSRWQDGSAVVLLSEDGASIQGFCPERLADEGSRIYRRFL